MNDILQTKIDKLARSAENVASAKNATQRNAAEKFLVQRAAELEKEQTRLALWLVEADDYLNENMPDIAADEDNEYNQEWLENLSDYQVISDVLSKSWDAFLSARKAA